MKRYHVLVSGRVQGVNYRNNTRRKAQELGLKGFVRNLPDGRVEIVAEGEAEKLDGFLEFCRRGPAFASVNDVEHEEKDYKNEFDAFTIRY